MVNMFNSELVKQCTKTSGKNIDIINMAHRYNTYNCYFTFQWNIFTSVNYIFPKKCVEEGEGVMATP